MAILIIQPSDGKNFRVPVTDTSIRIGRAKDNEVCLAADGAISRRHAEIWKKEDRFFVKDLGSHNGTFLDGSPVSEPTEFHPGQKIQTGRTVILLGDEHSPITEELSSESGLGLSSQSVILSAADFLRSESGISAPGVASVRGGDPRIRAFTALSRHAPELMADRPLDEVLELVLKMVFEATAPERGAVLLLGEDGKSLRVAVSKGMPGGDEGRRLISNTIADTVIKEGRSVLTADASVDPRFMEAKSIAIQSIHSAMSVPLWNRGNVSGMVYVDSVTRPTVLEKSDLEVLTLLGHLAAIKIEQIRLVERDRRMQTLEQELQAAGTIQQRLLPVQPPEFPGYELHGHNDPCHDVGGDYFDFQIRPSCRLAAAIGDVSGKGMGASLLMASLQSSFRAHVTTDADPVTLVGKLNRTIFENSDAGKFITFFYSEIDPSSGAVTYVNAGHNPPMIFRADGGIEELPSTGTILGFRPQVKYRQGDARLAPGDLLVLYTDGVNEEQAPDGEEFGEERLRQLVLDHRDEPVSTIGDRIREGVNRFRGKAEPFDDLTVCLIRRTRS